MADPQVAYAQDEYGNPFIVVREQGKKTRAQGTQAIKDHIQAARTVSNIPVSYTHLTLPTILLV